MFCSNPGLFPKAKAGAQGLDSRNYSLAGGRGVGSSSGTGKKRQAWLGPQLNLKPHSEVLMLLISELAL